MPETSQTPRDALISIYPTYVDQIMTGTKSVEFRRARVSLKPGTRLWMYATMPRGTVEGFTEIRSVVRDNPQAIWNEYQRAGAISRVAFDRYVRGCAEVSAITLGQAWRLHCSYTLSALRRLLSRFHPPQSYIWVAPEHPLYSALRSRSSHPAILHDAVESS